MMISIAFCGHLGASELGSAGLANSVITVTGIAIINGFAGASDTLGGQAYGARNYYRVGTILQKGILILILLCFPVWAAWANMDKLIVLAQQPEEVATGAWHYLLLFSPGVLGMVSYRLLRSFLQAQSIVKPSALTSFVCWLLNILLNYILVIVCDLGLTGAALASMITYLSFPAVLTSYIIISKTYTKTWMLSKECLYQWGTYVRLGLSGMAGELLLFTGNEIALFLMGLVGKPELAAQAVLFQVRSVLSMFSVGVLVSLCILVSNELGAGSPKRAKQTAELGFLMGLSMNLVITIILLSCRNVIGQVFSSDPLVLERIIQANPYVAVATFFSGVNNVIVGILIGCAKQKVFALFFFIGSYVIGLPLGSVLTFRQGMGIVGMWIGAATGMGAQFVLSLIYLARFMDYETVSKKAQEISLSTCRQSINEDEEVLHSDNDLIVFGNTESLKHILVKRGSVLAVCVVILVAGILTRISL